MELTDFQLVEQALQRLLYGVAAVCLLTPITMGTIWYINKPKDKPKSRENTCNCKNCRTIRAEIRQDQYAWEPDECPGLEGTDEQGAWLQGWWNGIDDDDQYKDDYDINEWDCGQSRNARRDTY
tara:strand:+ start:442 stop:813 length:372 start_codon:yes stop_codon:yes gene_type:complete